MLRVGIISAPLATLNRREPRLSLDLEDLVSHRGLLFVTHDLDELDSALAEFRRCGVEVIAVNGGDGTISRVLTAALRIWPADSLPMVFPLRGGNFNVLANDLGIRGKPIVLLRRLLAALEKPRRTYISRHTLLVDGNCGFIYADGSTARFLEDFYRKKGSPLESIQRLAELWLRKRDPDSDYWKLTRAERTRIEVAGDVRYDRPALSVLCSTLERMSYGQRMFRRTASRQRHFQWVTFDCSASDVLSRAILDSFVRPARSPHRTTQCADRIRVHGRNHRLYSLDGEVYAHPDGPIDIALGPELRFMTV